ncbi:GntR family transcriptional regulator [Arthrobacter sp. TMN-37]
MRASDRAYGSLRTDILEWRLTPGTLLAEVEQARRLGISRTPLREALSRLVAEGLAAPHAGRGVVVTEVSLAGIGDLFDVRLPLECAAVRLAAARRDPAVFDALAERFGAAGALISSGGTDQGAYYRLVADLDAAVDEAAGNPYLVQAQRQLRTHLLRTRRLARDNPHRLLASAAEHRQIAEAVARGNPDLAEAAVTIHLHNSLHQLRDSGPGTA